MYQDFQASLCREARGAQGQIHVLGRRTATSRWGRGEGGMRQPALLLLAHNPIHGDGIKWRPLRPSR